MNAQIYMAVAAAVILFTGVAIVRRQKFIVPEGHYGLLYRNGKYRHRISPGKHHFWTREYSVRLIDMRKIMLTVEAGEVLSADNVGLKVSAVLTYQIIQAETVVHGVRDYIAHLDQTVQVAIQSIVGAAPVGMLLSQRLDLGKQLFALVLPEADKIGIVVHAVEVREVILPDELRKAFAKPKNSLTEQV